MRYACPCCGYKTLPQGPPGTYALCPICDWEDDGVQFEDPDYEGGANFYSLRHEQKRFLSRTGPFGYSRSGGRDVTPEDEKGPGWRPLPQFGGSVNGQEVSNGLEKSTTEEDASSTGSD